MPKLAGVFPDRITVAVGGRVRLRVVGTVYGLVRVGQQRRWEWGSFDRSFVADVSKEAEAIKVELIGLGGRVTVRVQCEHHLNLRPPPPPVARPTLTPTLRPTIARTRRLRPVQFSPPRVVRLHQNPETAESTS